MPLLRRAPLWDAFPIALLVFTVIGSIPYALFVSASVALRQVTMVCLFLLVVVTGIGCGVMHYNPHLKGQAMWQVNEAQSAYSHVKDISELPKRLRW